ncbi:MAG: hypothetical protein ABJG77_17630, partial [Maribacter dokdonensis]
HTFNYSFENCFIKINESNASNYPDNTAFFSNIIMSGELDYFSPIDNDFRIGFESEAFNKGDVDTANAVPYDILGVSRITSPDLGAYQAIEKEF